LEELLASSSKQVARILGVWEEHLTVANALPALAETVSDAIDLTYGSLSSGGQLLAAGNGGSAADAQHIVAELTGRFLLERKPIRAMALHGNTSALTAIGNDYGYEHVFARELSAHARPGDVLLAISTSGSSGNILCAIEAARRHDMKVIGFTGASGGKMKSLCDLCICVPSSSTARIQEMHITIGHVMCEILEARLANA
jgi:D-sedoheptulose 7-phosphate isomerase